MASPISFQGLATGIQTDALVNAILAQEGTTVASMQARQTRNKARTSALTSMKSNMNAFSFSLAALQDKLNARTVTSTDANNTNVTATATGAAAGSYDLTVTTVATKGRISPTLVGGIPQNLAVADPTTAIFSGSSADFAVQGTDGVIKAFTVTSNSLNGLRDAINASGAGVSASVINTGAGTNRYQLVISAKETGTGGTNGTGGVVTIADVTSGGPVNTLGITAGTVDSMSSPTTLNGGLTSAVSGTNAVDAVFTLNGIQLTRQTNIVKDAADGVTFTLKQGGQTGTTTLTVAQDKAAATAGMQDMITKYNTLVKAYKDASTSTKNADGSINQGPLAGESTSRSIIAALRSTFVGPSSGLSGTYSILAGLGVQTLPDGTLSLNTVTFQAAIENDPVAAKRLFTFSGDSDNGVLTFNSASDKTATGAVAFVITEPTPGNFTGTFNGVAATPGSNGRLTGTGAYEGLVVTVTAPGSGTLSLGRGSGQATKDLLTGFTATGSGSLPNTLAAIDGQNRTLDIQIAAGQSALAKRKKSLQAKFSRMEVTIAQMRGGAGMLSSTTTIA